MNPKKESVIPAAEQMAIAMNTIMEIGFNHRALDDCRVGINMSVAICHQLSLIAGWWSNSDPTNPETFATKLCLIHSEISEAMEGGRKGLMDTHLPHRKMEEVELADALIRIFDLAGARGLRLGDAVIEKLAYNAKRADHKPEARAAEGGKKF